jgi:hypothetical protein
VIKEVLNIFSAASRLKINMGKTEIFSIRCESVSVAHLGAHNLVISSFPCKYLGLPLRHKKNLPKR